MDRRVWYFGNAAGLDFKTEPPTILTDGVLSQIEGCAVANDVNGKLLFYTDGQKIYNRNHQVMTNGSGLNGNISTTQSALIVKLPGTAEIYYVFTCEAQLMPKGLCYSIVDLSQSAGLGAVVTKNVLIRTPVTEKLAAVLHANRKDFWILCQEGLSNRYRAYVLNNSGIDTNSVVISTVGTYANYNQNYAGVMKVSWDGKKVVVVHHTMYRAEVFDFNNANGVMSNAYALPSSQFEPYYGATFSPNSRFLYLSESHFSTPCKIVQYDLLAGDSTQIRLSSKVVNPGNLIKNAGDLQVAPNGKIYIARFPQSFLSVIPSPDLMYPACGFIDTGQSLSTGICALGLPNFPVSNGLKTIINIKDTCFGDSTHFSFDPPQADSVKWHFGDPGSGASDQSDGLSPFHTYNAPGAYNVILYRYLNSSIDTVQATFSIRLPKKFSLGKDTVICPGDSVKIKPDVSGNFIYSWNTGDSSSSIFADTGLFILSLFDGCLSRDTIRISYDTGKFTFSLGPDREYCPGMDITLSPGISPATYKWQDSSTLPYLHVVKSGYYSVTVKKGCYSFTDMIFIDTCFCERNVSNVFTPNGDKINDRFRPETCTFGKNYAFIVFNRWGEVVFSTDSLYEEWDGRFNSKEVPEGTYFWMISYIDSGGKEKHISGVVTLLR